MNIRKIVGGLLVVVTVIVFVTDLVLNNTDGWHIWHTVIAVFGTFMFIGGVGLYAKDDEEVV